MKHLSSLANFLKKVFYSFHYKFNQKVFDEHIGKCIKSTHDSIVNEFRTAVGEKNVSDLYNALKLHRRCRKDADPEVKQAAVAIIFMLKSEWFPQFSDWREFVETPCL